MKRNLEKYRRTWLRDESSGRNTFEGLICGSITGTYYVDTPQGARRVSSAVYVRDKWFCG